MKSSSLLSLAALALILAGCTVGPDYKPPSTASVPPKWSEPLKGGVTSQPDSAATWWKSFHDPELDSLIDRAVAANLDLKTAEARVRQARAQQGIASSAYWPTLDANGSYNREWVSKNGDFPLPATVSQPLNLYQAGFDSSWEIDVFGGTRRNVEAAGAQVAAAEFSQRDVLVSLLGEVARSYVETRTAQQRLIIAQQNIQAQQDGLDLTRERYNKGLTSDLDVEQAATLLATTQAEVPTLQTSIQVSIHRLSVLLALPPGALSEELSKSAPIPAAPPQVPIGLPADLLLRRPDIQQAERQLAAQTALIGVATADLFPKFYLTGTAGLQTISASTFFNSGSKYWSIGPTIEWKLFEGDKIRSQIHVQTALQEQALDNYENTVLRSLADVEDSLVAYANEQTRRQSLEVAVDSSQQTLLLANERYSNGIASFLDVLEAERSLYVTQDQLAESDQSISIDLISLYKALGGGWEIQSHPAPVPAPTPAPTQPPAVAQM
jgi:NodT family efflux transporter outer membrane factor (OMF) lipoprotein